MELILIRHAQAESNLVDREAGLVGSDLDLTPEGIRQAEAVAAALGRLAIDGIIEPLPDLIYSSPYNRTQQTAEIIAAHYDRKVVTDYRLKEIQKGDWAGMKVGDVMPLEAAVPEGQRPYFRPPGVKGENWQDVAERTIQPINELEARGETSAIIVSHNHPILCAIGKLTGLEISDWESNPIDNASITRLVKQNGIWRIDENLYNYLPYH